ncbi:hypothetical protein V8N76_004580 [Salmonella enterica]
MTTATGRPKNFSIYPTEPLRDHLENCPQGKSNRINQMYDRYESIIRHCSLELEPDERQALLNVLQGKHADQTLIRFLAKEVLEGADYAAGSEAAKRLYLKLKTADYPALLATVERAGY